MKLTTPAIASAPYKAEAPSVRTSTRSMAEIGMAFRSMPAANPVSVGPRTREAVSVQQHQRACLADVV